MNTLTARDMRSILTQLDRVKELTDLLRRAYFDVPYETVYNAVGAEAAIREKLLAACICDVGVERMEKTTP